MDFIFVKGNPECQKLFFICVFRGTSCNDFNDCHPINVLGQSYHSLVSLLESTVGIDLSIATVKLMPQTDCLCPTICTFITSWFGTDFFWVWSSSSWYEDFFEFYLRLRPSLSLVAFYDTLKIEWITAFLIYRYRMIPINYSFIPKCQRKIPTCFTP